MDSLVMSRVSWDVLGALAVIVVGVLYIVFSLGMMLGERRAVQQAVPAPGTRDVHGARASRGRGRRDRVKGTGDPARLEDTVGEATRAIEEAATRAIQDLEERAAAAARLLDEAEDRVEQLKAAVAELEREAQEARHGPRSGFQAGEGASPSPSPGTCGTGTARDPLDGQAARHAVGPLVTGVAGTSRAAVEALTCGPATGVAPAAPADGRGDASAAGDAVGEERVNEAGAGPAPSGGPKVSEKHALVLSLADAGMTLPEIARRAGIGCGEAQLILELYGRQCLAGLSASLSRACAAPRDGRAR